jgi:glycosyltransferase involved in cell wall biosynthesis
VGQLAEHKGIESLLTAFVSLLPGIEARLEIVGSGAQEILVREAVTKHEQISYLGKLPNTQVHELMKTADCLVIPSLVYENSPTVILEAWNNNLAVIGSNLGGIAELLALPKLLFTPNDQASICARLLFAYRQTNELSAATKQAKATINQLTPSAYWLEIKKELW